MTAPSIEANFGIKCPQAVADILGRDPGTVNAILREGDAEALGTMVASCVLDLRRAGILPAPMPVLMDTLLRMTARRGFRLELPPWKNGSSKASPFVIVMREVSGPAEPPYFTDILEALPNAGGGQPLGLSLDEKAEQRRISLETWNTRWAQNMGDLDMTAMGRAMLSFMPALAKARGINEALTAATLLLDRSLSEQTNKTSPTLH